MSPRPRRPRSSIREHLRDTLWFAPLASMAVALVTAYAAINLDAVLVEVVREGDPGSVAGLISFTASAKGIISTVTSAMLTFVGVVFSISLVALQMASSQFSPRVLRLYVRSRITKAALSIFLATFVFALNVQLGYDDTSDPKEVTSVPVVSAALALLLVQVSLVLFVLYVNSTLRLLRVTFVMERIVAETMRALRYRHVEVPPEEALPEPVAAVHYDRRSGPLRAVNLTRLIWLARRHRVVIEVVPEVGDFLTTGTPVFRVHGEGSPPPRRLTACLSVGTERSMHQDVGFGLRQLSDIAIRALSPAVNDPTTAVTAIDRLQQILAVVATEPDSDTAWLDRRGALRVVMPESAFAGMVAQAFTEIRLCGRGQPQVTRRLTAALDDLEALAAEEHRAPLREQRALLLSDVLASVRTEEQIFALRPDRQGIS